MELTDDNTFYDPYTIGEVKNTLIAIHRKIVDNVFSRGSLFDDDLRKHFYGKYQVYGDNLSMLFLSFDANNREKVCGSEDVGNRMREFIALLHARISTCELAERLGLDEELCTDVLPLFVGSSNEVQSNIVEIANRIRKQVNEEHDL